VSSPAALLAVAAVALAPAAARGHEVLHEVERGRAIAVRAWFPDGEALAYAQYEIYSPADPTIPHQKGRTDRSGWLSFVPDAPGRWRVKVVDATGHGLDLEVDASSGAAAAPSPSQGPPGSTAAFVLRPLLGVAVIAAVFAVLFVVKRRTGRAR
jgi:nickel transport protein